MLFVADFMEFYTVKQILWTKILFVADFMDKDTVCSIFYGLRCCLEQILWTKMLFVADFTDKDTVCCRIFTKEQLRAKWNK